MDKATNLYAARGHFKFGGERLAKGGVGFCLAFEGILENLQLGTGCSFPMFNF